MKKERKDKNFVKKPIYPGGDKAIKKFLAENKKYPEDAQKNKITGTVSLRYTINHLGEVIDTHIISGLGYGCDEEAERLVKMLKFHVDKVRGMRVTFKKEIHIHFRKPKVIQKKKQLPQIQYQYTKTILKSQKIASKIEPKKANGYQYTITIK